MTVTALVGEAERGRRARRAAPCCTAARCPISPSLNDPDLAVQPGSPGSSPWPASGDRSASRAPVHLTGVVGRVADQARRHVHDDVLELLDQCADREERTSEEQSAHRRERDRRRQRRGVLPAWKTSDRVASLLTAVNWVEPKWVGRPDPGRLLLREIVRRPGARDLDRVDERPRRARIDRRRDAEVDLGARQQAGRVEGARGRLPDRLAAERVELGRGARVGRRHAGRERVGERQLAAERRVADISDDGEDFRRAASRDRVRHVRVQLQRRVGRRGRRRGEQEPGGDQAARTTRVRIVVLIASRSLGGLERQAHRRG